ncbi:MAG: hypothetical protein EPO28_00435 [Saprospiraceae bacterium]|nr:MAG: hypothetical protein EPO28_00435 [Saprospiraceae bacterium]
MRKFIILISFIAIVISCKKEDTGFPIPIYQPGPMTYGKATAVKATENWTASAYGQEEDWSEGTVSVIAQTYSEEGFLREILSFQEVPKKIGKYNLSKTISPNDGLVLASYGNIIDDGDVLGDYYNLDLNATDNFVEVTYIDTLERIIRGKFTATFVIDLTGAYKEKIDPANPDKVKFWNGMFDVKIIE